MSRHVHRALRWHALTACILAAALAAPAQAAADDRGGKSRQVRMNQIQTINTHNSYKRELSPQEEAAHDALAGSVGAYDGGSAYSHVTLGRQFARQDVRGIELDLWPDPQGGLYAHPLVRKHLGIGPLPDPAWQQPGFKVLHVADADYNSSCVQFTTCLRQVKTWSDANSNHVPLFVMLELKQSSRAWIDRGGVVAPPWDLGQFERVDAEIRSVFRKHELIVPDDVRRPGLTVEQSITTHGWPTLEEARGKVMFFFNNVGSSSLYSEGHPNLEDRLAFVNAAPGNPNSAYHGRDEVLDLFPLIQDLVSRNYLIRTRSDISLSTVRAGDMRPVEAALASGAQLISTDFPSEGMSGRYGTDFAVQLPEGLPARCNPVNAPPRCRSDRLEQPSAGRSRR